MNIFLGLKQYATQFQVINRRAFDAEEIEKVKNAKVVASEYGMSVCFFMKEGYQTYIPVSRDSNPNIGDTVDLTTAKILTLEKDGNTINRIEI